MHDTSTTTVPSAAARRRVQAGLWMFFTGTIALLFALVAQLGAQAQAAPLAERFPSLPTWFVPESPAGYTAALMMVCWGVWALGQGLRSARERG